MTMFASPKGRRSEFELHGRRANRGLAVGERFPGVPRNQASLWTTYEFQNDFGSKGFKIGAGYHYMGSRPVNDTAQLRPLRLAL